MAQHMFNRDELFEAISDLEKLYSDLDFIDHATEVIEQNLVPDDEDAGLTNTSRGFRINLQGYPELSFDYGGLFDQDWLYENEHSFQATLDGLYKDGAGTGIFGGLRDSIADYIDPDPSALEAAANRIAEDVGTPLSESFDSDLGNISQELQDWHGGARDAFVANFHHPFGEILERQAYLASTIVSMLTTAKALVDLNRQSTMNIIVEFRDTMKAQVQAWHDSQTDPPITWHDVILLGSTALSLLSLVPVPAVGVTASVAGTALSFATDGVPDEDREPDVQVPQSTASEMVHEFFTAFFKMQANITNHWYDAESGEKSSLDAAKRVMHDWERQDLPYFPAEPGLDSYGPGEFEFGDEN